VVAVAQRLAAQVLGWSAGLRELRLLLGERAAHFPEAAAEGRAQLDFLLRPGFLRDTEPHWLEQYSRYFQAAIARFERLPGQLARDRANADVIAGLLAWWTARESAAAQRDPQAAVALQDFRYRVEEFLVSLYAQQLRTRVPVSAKRLSALRAELEERWFAR
jgi:ATP-dependent helicase HrpA